MSNWTAMRRWPRSALSWLMVVILSGCGAALLLASGSLSSSIPSVAALSFFIETLPARVFLIPQEPGPTKVVIAAQGRRLAIANEGRRSVSLMDTDSYEVVASVPTSVGDFGEPLLPLTLESVPGTDTLYVGQREPFNFAGSILEVDAATGDIRARFATDDIAAGVGDGVPVAMAVAPEAGKLYVLLNLVNGGEGPDTLAVFDTATRALVRTLEIGQQPRSLVLAPDEQWLAIAVTGDLEGDPTFGIPPSPGSTVVLVDTETDQITDTIQVGQGPLMMVSSSDGRQLYVVNAFDGTLSIIDVESAQVVSTLPVGEDPRGLAYSERFQRLFVSSFVESTVSVIDPVAGSVVAGVSLPQRPTALALGIEETRLFAALPESDQVVALSAREILGYVPVGDHPIAVVFEPGEGEGFALASESNDVTAFNPVTLEVNAISALALDPFSVRLTPDGRQAYTANSSHNTVSVIDTIEGEVIGQIPVGNRPVEVAFSPSGDRAYVANLNGDSISVIDTTTLEVVDTFTDLGGEAPIDLLVSPDGAYLIVANLDSFSVALLDRGSGTLVAIVYLGEFFAPTELALSADGTQLFMADVDAFFSESRVSVLDLETWQLVQPVLLAEDLADLEPGFGPTAGSVFGANGLFGEVLRIDAATLNVTARFDAELTAPLELALVDGGATLLVLETGYYSGAGVLLALHPDDGAVHYSSGLDGVATGLAVSPDASTVYVTIPGLDRVDVFDVTTGDRLDSVSLPRIRFPAP